MKQMKSMMSAILSTVKQSVSIKDKNMVFANELPANVKSFVQENFPGRSISYAEKENNGYEVSLNDGTEVFFTEEGSWGKVSSHQAPLPFSLLPKSIIANLSQLFTDVLVMGIAKRQLSYSVSLSNGVSLKYDMQGRLV